MCARGGTDTIKASDAFGPGSSPGGRTIQKNKTNLDENSKFVFSLQASREGSLGSFGLFFTRDYFGLSVKIE